MRHKAGLMSVFFFSYIQTEASHAYYRKVKVKVLIHSLIDWSRRSTTAIWCQVKAEGREPIHQVALLVHVSTAHQLITSCCHEVVIIYELFPRSFYHLNSKNCPSMHATLANLTNNGN